MYKSGEKRLKKIICFILIVVSIFSLSACGNKSETSLLTSENKSKLFPEGSKIENLRLNSMNYSEFKDNNEGFNLVGNSKDKEESDFIYKQMKENGEISKDFKLIFGNEIYLIDDSKKEDIANNKYVKYTI